MALCPFATQRPVQNHGGPMRGYWFFIPHRVQGNGSPFGEFNDPAPGGDPHAAVSAHFWCAKDGQLEQYVDTSLEAWAEAAGNGYAVSCETEGFITEPYTPQQIATLGALYRWVHETHGVPYAITDDPIHGTGIGTHRMGGAAWGGHSCPGDLNANQRGLILNAATAASTPPPEDDVTPEQAEDIVAAVVSRLGGGDGHGPIGIDVNATGLRVEDLEQRGARIEADLAAIKAHLGIAP